MTGIQVTTGTNTVSNNTVGSATTANSLNSTGQIKGIAATGGTNTVSLNNVRNLTSSFATGTGSAASVIGILQTSSSGQTVSQNTIHTLTNTDPDDPVQATGIFIAGNNTVERNLIYGISLSTTNIAAVINGIEATATSTYQNNMIRLGLDAAGASLTTGYVINGINESDAAGGGNFYFNSVFVGGTGVVGFANTFAFNSASTVPPSPHNSKNNIFYNGRSGTGKHYAVQIANMPSGLTSNHNIFFVDGTNGVLGRYNGTDQTTIQAWRNATGQDSASAFANPNFVDQNGVTPNLHLSSPTPAEAAGLAIAGVTDDFDGQLRASFTPTDIGADAGNFTSSGDVFPPAISYTLLSTGSTMNRVLTNFATITDNVGVSDTPNRPRLYFKRSTDADVFGGGNTSGVNGWKFDEADNSTSPYSFTIDYSIIFGGSVANGDTIEYFVVAQDAANNLGSNPAGAGASGNPPVQNINAKPATVNSYLISELSGTKSVCPGGGCDYTSLTGPAPGGIFAAINSSVLSSDLIINISGNLPLEPGTNALNQWAEDGPGAPHNVTIQPDSATMRTISGSVAVAGGMIRLNGADRVTIDGRFGGTGRFLTFRNTNATQPAITLLNDASNNTLRSSIIESPANSGSTGVVLFSTGATTGNDNNTVTDNHIRDRSDAAGVPRNLFFSEGSASAGAANSNNIISNNELFNFGSNNASQGINIRPTGNESWTIQGNTIYETAARTVALIGIAFSSAGTNLVVENVIRDLNTSNSATGIDLGNVVGTNVLRNRIHAFPSTLSSTGTLTGIRYTGDSTSSVTVANNQITLIPSFTNDQIIRGIDDVGSGGTFTTVFNSVLIGGTATGTQSTWACVRSGSASTHTSRNNICFNNRTGGTGNHFAAGRQVGAGSFTSDHNVFVGTERHCRQLYGF